MMQQRDESDNDGAVAGSIPTLGYPEIVLGRVIGTGGFSVVNEITQIKLQEVFDTSDAEAKQRSALAESCQDESHYVLKTLRMDLPEDEHTKGIVDLAVEARFLAKLSHPNIITMRATANSDPLESKYFVVLDRLVSTLDDKLRSWRLEIGKSMGMWCGPCIGYCCAKKHVLHRLWIDRLLVAKDVASAVRYLHDQDIVYRDLKPDNVGFNIEGGVKLFDFGLAKHLHPDDKTGDDLYMLTGNTGSLRYMAPEVARGEPYNASVDSYSFGILFWQICALTTPYSGYSCKMHADLVVGKGYRPKPDSSWPEYWSRLMRECWSTDIFVRPSFDHIARVLDEEIDDLLQDEDGGHRNANTVRARKKKSFKIKAKQDGQRLDVDTRLVNADEGPGDKIHDADVV